MHLQLWDLQELTSVLEVRMSIGSKVPFLLPKSLFLECKVLQQQGPAHLQDDDWLGHQEVRKPRNSHGLYVVFWRYIYPLGNLKKREMRKG